MQGHNNNRFPGGVPRQPPPQPPPQQPPLQNPYLQNPNNNFYQNPNNTFIQNPNNPFIQNPNNPFIRNPNNPFIQNPNNTFIQHPNNPFFQNPNNPFFQNPYPPNPNFIFQNPNPIPPPNNPQPKKIPNPTPKSNSGVVKIPNPTPKSNSGMEKISNPTTKSNSGVEKIPNPTPKFNSFVEKIERAVVKAREEMAAAREHVSAWKVSQAVLAEMKEESWEALGVAMEQVPSLHRLIVTEGKINAFIHCFVAVRKITSLHDLDIAICKNEGLQRYEELELGPLVRHPLAIHYFSVSSDAKDIFHITSEEINSYLCEFIDIHKGSGISIDEFLDFAAKKKSVSGREKLSVRIQSLGMHISFIRQAKRLENDTLKKCLKDMKRNSSKGFRKRPLMSSQKRQLDEHFSSISKRIESFSSVNKDFGGTGKHLRFISSSSEENGSEESDDEVDKDLEDYDSPCNQMSKNSGSSNQPSRCPYPSAAEERSRLGLKKAEVDIDPSPANDSLDSEKSHEMLKRKRKPENISSNSTARRKLPKPDNYEPDIMLKSKKDFVNQDEADFSLDDNSMRMFIMMWKEACRVNSVTEVFWRMLQFYKIHIPKKRLKWFSSHPLIGLLNVAVISIARGMWDSMYDDFQDFDDHGVAVTVPDSCTLYESIEVEPAETDAVGTTNYGIKHVPVDDIVQKVSTYFELDYKTLSNVELRLENKLSFLRKLCKCEFWLAKQFSVEKFKSLGYGKFFMFLEKHVFILHNALQKCLNGDTFKKPSLEVRMFEDQLAVLLSQAVNNCPEDKNITEDMIPPLLTRQFPLVNFVLAESGLHEDFMDDVKKKGSISTRVLFSATLLVGHKEDTVSEKDPSGTGLGETSIGYEDKTFCTVTTNDAIKVLLRAPMLSDLISWTHWDVVFAPSLGPLMRWLLNDVNVKGLLCLVTKDGKVIRIDHTASVDSFFEACLQGSSFQTAVELLSLLSLYGGEAHVPLSLLKCHARQAFEVILKNSEVIANNEDKPTLLPENSLYKHFLSRDTSGSSSTDRSNVKVASFFIDCLSHLPGEFRAFAADILLSGLQSMLKNAPSIILYECKQIDQRHLLHDVGLFLGIVEWIDDYHSFASSMASDSLIPSGTPCLEIVDPDSGRGPDSTKDELCELITAECKTSVSVGFDAVKEESNHKECKRMRDSLNEETSASQCDAYDKENEALMVIESIRREEFGLDPGLSAMEAGMLKKQHARLGRALHCLSQELYSQDSHFLLELIQNADDNIYPGNVEPTLTFILQESGIVVLNNEQGFSSQNIRALCDVGSSTKKGVTGGYIGKKGIGFKSVFRVTDAPEIHSNGFHVKFDISEGQIGFVLPTVVPACDVDFYRKLVSCDTDKTEPSCWNTCIVLPFRTKLSQDSSMNSIRSMFCDLHPSLLVFLHRLQCIRYRSIPDDTMVIMTKELLGNGIVNVSFGKEKMTWFVASQVLQADVIRPDVQTTEISIAFTLQESGNGEYIPRLEQQPVFAFLPLRKYGLKFIIQGDFVLPSSREEVDGDSPWNQWLLAKFPDLFVNAEKSFCAFPCYRDTPGKAVSFFMSFVPLVGEVQGFFSSLPRLIISKLRMSKCLLMEGDKEELVLPCKVLRNWNDEALNLFPGSCLREHLGLGFLDRNIVLSDSLARDLGIQDYGPSVLVQVMTSFCHSEKGIKSAGLVWLSSCLNALYMMLFNSSGQISSISGAASDVINSLRKVPFIPLSGGAYSSVDDGTIWLHSNSSSPGISNEHHPDNFPALYAKLRTVSPTLFSAAATVDISGSGMSLVDTVTRILLRIGVQQLSDHEILKVHILPAISDDRITLDDKNMMLEYLSFVMCHLQSSCSNCHVERGHILSELRERAFILTNYGYKRPTEVAIHFSGEYGNTMDVNKLINGMDLKWHEVDVAYLQHPITGSLSSGMRQWREFFQEMGISDFVQVVSVEKGVTDLCNADLKNMLWDGERIPNDAVAQDWESQELVHLLSQLSLSKDRIKSQYLLETLDTFWDEYFSNKVAGSFIFNSAENSRVFKSSFINCLCDIQWVASSTDDKLHYAKELFYDCESVRLVLGANASYAVPKLKSEKLLSDIGFKTQVSLDDVLSVLRAWRKSETPFMASIAQMSKFYTFVLNEMATSKEKIVAELQLGSFIFCPYSWGSHDDVVLGVLLSPSEVHWHDFTGSIRQIKETLHHRDSSAVDLPLCKTLSNIYPSLHTFFVNECGVSEIPPQRSYLQILLELSAVALPSQSAKTVFQVFLQWSDGLKSGLLNSNDVIYLKECLQKLEFTILPTLLDKWVSLHPSFGLVCWCDDSKLKKEFKALDNIEFLYFGELSDDEQDLLRSKVSVVLQTLGIPSLSAVITREAIYDGMTDCSFKTSLLNWAFPYAQRFIYNTHRDRYLELKQSGFEFVSKLRIIVVDKLFSRNIIKGFNIASSKRRECKCLLQGNLLYATQESDSHSLFMEFSHFLVGVPDLHLANFLHMITTMAESGSNEDQTEFFILNSQRIPKLPNGEPMWSLPSPSFMENDAIPQTNHGSINLIDQTPTNPERKHGVGSSWPPTDWKTAPGFSFPHSSGMKVQPAICANDNRIAKTVHEGPSETGTSCNSIATEECRSTSVTAVVVVPDPQALENHGKVVDLIDLDTEIDGPKYRPFFPSARVNLSHSTSNPQALLTGRMGEHVAYNYFSAIAGKKDVQWVNQDIESGLPYDLVIEDEQNSQEYIEVKATKSSNKDWFHITLREWQFAMEKGENFTIAHIILSDNVMAKITMFKNPVKLCQLGKLHLAVLMPKQPEEFSTFS